MKPTLARLLLVSSASFTLTALLFGVSGALSGGSQRGVRFRIFAWILFGAAICLGIAGATLAHMSLGH